MLTRKEATQKAVETILVAGSRFTGDFTDPPPNPDVAGGIPYEQLTFDEKQEYFALSRRRGLDGSVPDGIAFGGSDMGTILNLSKWKSCLELYFLKREEQAEEITPEKQALFDAGHIMEPAYRDMFNRFNGEGMTAYPFEYQFGSNVWPHALGNIDGVVVDKDGVVGLYEGKTTNFNNRIATTGYREGIVMPLYMAQVYFYLAITGFPYAIVNCGWGSQSDGLAHVRIERPPEDVLAAYMEKGEEFIAACLGGNPPSEFDAASFDLVARDIARQDADIINAKKKGAFVLPDPESEALAEEMIALYEKYKGFKDSAEEYETLWKLRAAALSKRVFGEGLASGKSETERHTFTLGASINAQRRGKREICEEKYPQLLDELFPVTVSDKVGYRLSFKEKDPQDAKPNQAA
jgi:predicted phage-related endonuclease